MDLPMNLSMDLPINNLEQTMDLPINNLKQTMYLPINSTYRDINSRAIALIARRLVK